MKKILLLGIIPIFTLITMQSVYAGNITLKEVYGLVDVYIDSLSSDYGSTKLNQLKKNINDQLKRSASKNNKRKGQFIDEDYAKDIIAQILRKYGFVKTNFDNTDLSEKERMEIAIALSLKDQKNQPEKHNFDEDEFDSVIKQSKQTAKKEQEARKKKQEDRDAALALKQQQIEDDKALALKQQQIEDDEAFAREQQQMEDDDRKPEKQNEKKQHNFGQTIKLPKEFQNRNFVQIKVPKQKGSTCGSYAALYAYTIQILVENFIELTSQNIIKEMIKHKKSLINKEIEIKDIFTEFINKRKIKNIYFLKHGLKHSIEAAGTGDDVEYSLEEFMFRTKVLDNVIGHIICNTGGHWVLFSVIKQKNKYGNKPLLIYIDSGDNPLNSGSAQEAFAKYFLEKLEK